MQFRPFFTSLAFCLSTVAFAAPPSIKEAEKLANSGKYDSAILSLRKIANDKSQSATTREEALQKLINYVQLQSLMFSKNDRATYLSAFKGDYQALLLLRPDDGEVYFDYGNFLTDLGESTLSFDAYMKALYLGYRQAAAPLGATYLARKEYEDAVSMLKIATEVKPADYYQWFLLGFSQFRLNDFEAAVDSLGKAYKLDTIRSYSQQKDIIENLSLPEVYVSTLIELERYPEAITVAKSFSNFINIILGFSFVASVYSDANQPENAIFYYTRAVDAASKLIESKPMVFANTLNSYAWFFCTTPNKKYQTPEYLLKAFKMATKAVELSKRRAAYLDTLAEVYYLLGYPEEALPLEKEALGKEPDRAFYNEQIAKYEAALDTPPPVLVPFEDLQSTPGTLLPEGGLDPNKGSLQQKRP
jgi:tetratricopeptide (TPR) repeat protein